MSVTDGAFLRRLFSGRAFTAISHYFVMDVYGIWVDLAAGFLIAGAVAAWIPNSFWKGWLGDRDRAGRLRRTDLLLLLSRLPWCLRERTRALSGDGDDGGGPSAIRAPSGRLRRLTCW